MFYSKYVQLLMKIISSVFVQDLIFWTKLNIVHVT